MPLPRLLRLSLLSLASLCCVLAALIYSLTWHPAAREAAPVSCLVKAPLLQPGQTLKVMTWNIQFLAGKRYVFWYDLADGSGPDQRPSTEDLAFTLMKWRASCVTSSRISSCCRNCTTVPRPRTTRTSWRCCMSA